MSEPSSWDGSGTTSERRDVSSPSHPPRGSTPGRRAEDQLPRATFTKKVLVAVITLVNGLYLVGEALIFGASAPC